MFKYKLSCKKFIKHYFPRQSVSALTPTPKRLVWGFTLVELLIVVGVLAALGVSAVVVLNPLGQLQQARDSNRLTGLESVRQTLSLLNLGNSPPSFGSSNVIYVSLPDNVSPTCASWNLPAPPTGWSYACQSEANFKKVNGSGWLPIDLTSTTFSTSSSVLPTDPQNNTTNYYYYVYDSTTGAYELGAVLEADKNQTLAINDGGDNPGFWELGSRLSLYPATGNLAVNNESNQPVTNESSLLAYAQAAIPGQVAYFIGTNQITGSNDFFWNDSTKRLTVAGTVESTGFKLTTAPTAGYVLTADTSGVGTWQAAAGGSQWITSGSNIYFNTGNVGIGTTGPGTKLDILGGLTSETDGSQRIRLRGYSAGLEIVDKDNVENFYIAIDDDDSNYLKIGPGYGPGQGLGTYLTIKSSGVAGAGNVGIGTTGPSYKLDVSGQINTSGGLCIAGDCKTSWSQVGGSQMNSGLTTGTAISNTASTSTVITHGLSVVPKIINVITATSGRGDSWGYAATDGVSLITSQNAVSGRETNEPIRLIAGSIAASCYVGCNTAAITAVTSTTFTITFNSAGYSGNDGIPMFIWEVFR